MDELWWFLQSYHMAQKSNDYITAAVRISSLKLHHFKGTDVPLSDMA